MKLKRKKLSTKFAGALVALLIAVVAASAATFAWYIYNTQGRTTTVRMAAGSASSLLISKERDGNYSYYTSLEPLEGTFNATLTPVSTDKIIKPNGEVGFQRVVSFKDGDKTKSQPAKVTDLFAKAETTDYYKVSLFLKASADDTDVYVKRIGGEDKNAALPISTATRIGLVVNPGTADKQEFIFALSKEKNPNAEYNTDQGHDGCVLNSEGPNGSVVEFAPLDESNWCEYNNETGQITLKNGSKKICTCKGAGDPVQVDIYVWLEGCDADCTSSLSSAVLNNVSIEFAGINDSNK